MPDIINCNLKKDEMFLIIKHIFVTVNNTKKQYPKSLVFVQIALGYSHHFAYSRHGSIHAFANCI